MTKGPQPKPDTICRIKGCSLICDKYKSSGLCATHYDKQNKVSRGIVCSVDGCLEFAHTVASGLCPKHYRIWLPSVRGTVCNWRACDSLVEAVGMCMKHYGILKRYNVTEEKYIKMLQEQENCCMICLGQFNKEFPPVIDHDHGCCPKKSTSCGLCVRGLAHDPCNAMEGKVRRMIETGITPVKLDWMVK